MTTAYLNGDFVALEDARISPMDRGFLFGDGIYEVIPSYGGRMVGFERHMQRLNQGLKAIELDNPLSEEGWQQLLLQLMEHNEGSFLGLYLQVTRGASMVRNHKFPADIPQTIFAYPFEVNAPCDGSPEQASCYRVATATDRRWRRCDIKSVALLGNVLHMMEGVSAGADEVLLFNEQDELTEAAACNAFVVVGNDIITPPLDREKLPGITRNMLVDILASEGIAVNETAVTRDMLSSADEVWLTSSTKEVAPVIAVDGRAVNGGKPGPVWTRAQTLFAQHRFTF